MGVNLNFLAEAVRFPILARRRSIKNSMSGYWYSIVGSQNLLYPIPNQYQYSTYKAAIRNKEITENKYFEEQKD
jgi:hypothetical protein